MIKLMIVDDEERARNGICSLISWEQHNIEIVAEARDGLEALELLETNPIDIVLTDIRMPEMDGLTLIEHIKQSFPAAKVVIMSGYDDFHYAKKAISLGASDYLLKPSRRDEILATVLNLKSEILKEREQKHHLEELKEGFRNSFPLLIEKTLSRLVLSEDPPYDKLLNALHINGVDFPHTYYGVIIVQIDHLHDLQKQYIQYDIELFKYALKKISEESIEHTVICAAFDYEDDIIIIINSDNSLSSEALLALSRTIQHNANKFLNMTVSIGIGEMHSSIKSLQTSCSLARNALNANYHMGPGNIAAPTDIAMETSVSAYPTLIEQNIIRAIITSDTEGLAANLTKFQFLLQPHGTTKDQVLNFYFALFFSMYRLCIDKEINLEDIFGNELLNKLLQLSKSSIYDIHHEVVHISHKIMERMESKKNGNKLFDSILAFIRQNYYKDLSREIVASEVFITPGYLSLLFKQQMKISFLDFLHKTRIEQACSLLSDKSKRIGDIALKVGYNDEKYFFQVFKKYIGMTPNQYRNHFSE
jgi:two-component system response regulator YesN